MREEMLYLKEYEDREEAFWHDKERMNRFCKREVADYQRIIELECDKLEYNGSLMYADIVDENQIYYMVEQIAKQIVAPEQCDRMQPWIMMLLCNEMYVRRCRKCRRDSMFCR